VNASRPPARCRMPRLFGPLQIGGCPVRPRRRRDHDQEPIGGARRERGKPRREQPLEISRHGERFPGCRPDTMLDEGPSDLEREQRVAFGHPVDPQQDGVRETPLGSSSQEAGHRLLGQPGPAHPPDDGPRTPAPWPRAAHPATGRRRWRRAPDRTRPARAGLPATRPTPLAGPVGTLELRAQEGGIQRALLRGREVGELEVEEVSERRTGEQGLRFRPPAGQHPMTSRPGDRHARMPQGRLADPGRSLQEQGRGPARHRPDEGRHPGELALPPKDPGNRLVHPTPSPASGPILWGSSRRDQSRDPGSCWSTPAGCCAGPGGPPQPEKPVMASPTSLTPTIRHSTAMMAVLWLAIQVLSPSSSPAARLPMAK
jgi:hypothetical protein